MSIMHKGVLIAHNLIATSRLGQPTPQWTIPGSVVSREGKVVSESFATPSLVDLVNKLTPIMVQEYFTTRIPAETIRVPDYFHFALTDAKIHVDILFEPLWNRSAESQVDHQWVAILHSAAIADRAYRVEAPTLNALLFTILARALAKDWVKDFHGIKGLADTDPKMVAFESVVIDFPPLRPMPEEDYEFIASVYSAYLNAQEQAAAMQLIPVTSTNPVPAEG